MRKEANEDIFFEVCEVRRSVPVPEVVPNKNTLAVWGAGISIVNCGWRGQLLSFYLLSSTFFNTQTNLFSLQPKWEEKTMVEFSLAIVETNTRIMMVLSINLVIHVEEFETEDNTDQAWTDGGQNFLSHVC